MSLFLASLRIDILPTTQLSKMHLDKRLWVVFCALYWLSVQRKKKDNCNLQGIGNNSNGLYISNFHMWASRVSDSQIITFTEEMFSAFISCRDQHAVPIAKVQDFVQSGWVSLMQPAKALLNTHVRFSYTWQSSASDSAKRCINLHNYYEYIVYSLYCCNSIICNHLFSL